MTESDSKRQLGRWTTYEVCLHLSTGGFKHIRVDTNAKSQVLSKAKAEVDETVLQARVVSSILKDGSEGASGDGHLFECHCEGLQTTKGGRK